MNIFTINQLYWRKQGKKVCKTTAVQCYRYGLRLLLFLALRAKRLPPEKSYSALLLTAADRCKKALDYYHLDINWAYLVVFQSGLSLGRSGTWTTPAARGSSTLPSTPPNMAESHTSMTPKRASEEYCQILQENLLLKVNIPKMPKIVSYSVLMFWVFSLLD